MQKYFFFNSFLYFILNFFSFRYSRFFQKCFLLGTEVFFKSCVFFIYNFFLLGTEVVFPKAFSCRYRSLLGRNFFLLGTEIFSFRYRRFFFKVQTCFLLFQVIFKNVKFSLFKSNFFVCSKALRFVQKH